MVNKQTSCFRNLIPTTTTRCRTWCVSVLDTSVDCCCEQLSAGEFAAEFCRYQRALRTRSPPHPPNPTETDALDQPALQLQGVSVLHLQTEFLEAVVQAVGADAKVYQVEPLIRSRGETTRCPRDGKLGCAYVNAIGNGAAGPADFILSYTWGYSIVDIVAVIVAYCEREALEQASTHVWICCLCINMHRGGGKQVLKQVVTTDTFRGAFKIVKTDEFKGVFMMSKVPLKFSAVSCDSRSGFGKSVSSIMGEHVSEYLEGILESLPEVDEWADMDAPTYSAGSTLRESLQQQISDTVLEVCQDVALKTAGKKGPTCSLCQPVLSTGKVSIELAKRKTEEILCYQAKDNTTSAEVSWRGCVVSSVICAES